MKFKNSLILLLIIAFSKMHIQYVYAQFHDMKFKYLTVENGLSNNRIRCIFRDSKGFLWTGTDFGLNKFDGTKNTIYETVESDVNTISSNFINCIFEDSKQNLWIGTQKGLDLFNIKTESFIHFKQEAGNSNSLNDNYISSIIEDKKGNLWIATFNGLHKFDPLKRSFIRFFPVNESSNIGNNIDNICFDKYENIWLATKGNRIFNFNTETSKFSSYSNQLLNSVTDQRKKIVIDDKGILWIGISDSGLFSFNPSNNQFQRYSASGNYNGTYGNMIRDMMLDGNRYLLIAIDYGGINRLDLQTHTFEYCLFDEKKEKGLNSNGLSVLYKDYEGILYAGTSSAGLNIYNPKKEKFTTYRHSFINNNSLVYNIVRYIFEDSKGLIWIGTSGGGLSVFDPKTKSFNNFKHNIADPNSISSDAVLCITEDNNHDIWLGTWGTGLNKFDRKSGKFYQYQHNPKDATTISSNNIYDLLTDKKGYLWISYAPGSFEVFDPKIGVIKKYQINQPQNNSIHSSVRRFIRQSDNNFGFATDSGYYYLKNNMDTFYRFKPLNGIPLNNVHFDKKGNCWAATIDKGLWTIWANGKIEKHSKSNGFPSNNIFGILEDKHGNVWISSSEGISKYNIVTHKFQHYSVLDGLQGKQFAKYASLKSSDGTFYFGGYNGLNVFNPESVKVNDYLPKVYVNDFQIFNKSISPNSTDSPLEQTISTVKEIVLTYKQSFFSFSYNAVDFTCPEKIQYAYKMYGYDKDWNYTDASRKYASYTNLDPGEYIFVVKCSNSDGIWNKNTTSIKITITPPLWKTWWFKTFFIFFILGSAIILYKLRVAQLKSRASDLELKVKERTIELEDSNTKLEEKQEEILQQNEEIKLQKELVENQHAKIEKAYMELSLYENQLEEIVKTRTRELLAAKQKAEESDKLKSSFLANLSHEIRTPLNAIVGFSGLLTDSDTDITQQEMFKSMIQSSSDTLLNLIDDILDFSKIEAGQIDIVKMPVTISKITTELKRLYQFELTMLKNRFNKEIDFRVIEPISPITQFIVTDESRLKQILQNLINNAIKFTSKGFVELGYHLTADAKFVKFYVKDTGIGIKKEDQEFIFRRFRKIENTSNLVYRGTGIGLSICKHLTKLLGGQIKVESEPDKGSTFSFTIPYQIEINQTQKEDSNITKSSIPDFTGISVLLAEDDDSNFFLTQTFLKKTNISTIRATNGNEAVSICSKNPSIRLVLMDIKMPLMDGFEALKHIRKIKPLMIVIAQTAHSYQEEIDKIVAEGFTDYILKPINAKNLIAMLEKYLEK